MAIKACELSDWKEPNYLDTLAAACAEVGDFDQAVKREEAAIRLYDPKDEETLKGCRDRLAIYRDRKPYRQP